MDLVAGGGHTRGRESLTPTVRGAPNAHVSIDLGTEAFFDLLVESNLAARVGCLVMTVGGAPEWEWPDSLDALTAAPQNHRLLVENDEVGVLDTEVKR